MKRNSCSIRSVVLLTALFLLICSDDAVSGKPKGEAVVIHTQTCENQINPIGIGTPFPRLGWTSKNLDTCYAYQIIVSDRPEDMQARKGRMWDSGIVVSDRQTDILYAGKRLKSGVRYYWCVRVFDAAGISSGWSETAWFETVFLSPKEWSV